MDYLRPIGVLLLFFVILYGAYIASKWTATLQSGQNKGRNMTIIEAISVGPQKTLQIVRVGKTYMVIGVSRDKITYLKEVDFSELEIVSPKDSLPFSKILDKVVHRNQREEPPVETGEEQDESNE